MIKMSIKIQDPFFEEEKWFTTGCFRGLYTCFLFFVLILLFVPYQLFASEPGRANRVERADQLPPAVARMHQAMMRAARSGQIDNMREVLQMNELMPLIDGKFIHDPIAFWKNASPDRTGREILAVFTELLELPPVKKATKNGDLYIWPYFAGVSLQKLAPFELVQLYRLAPAGKIAKMLRNNKYSHAFVSIGADGTWHAFGHENE